ncbi:TPA: hypothetical protein DEB00_01455 [Candidatus Uhrbacteria bacterium]|nr:hypothetical protein [Candidatus Uhrbacteria bacterium]
MSNRLFPPYLNAGSFGDAVWVMQMILNGLVGSRRTVEVNGRHEGESVKAVMRLQREILGLAESEVDGNFGPGTRKALRERFGIDVDVIPLPVVTISLYTQWMGPDHVGIKYWPPR